MTTLSAFNFNSLQISSATERTVRSSCAPMLYTPRSSPWCKMLSNAFAASATCMYDLVAIPSPCKGICKPLFANMINFGIAFSGNWCGPYTLFPLVMTYGKSYERPYAMTSISAPALVAEYGFVGSNKLACSVFEAFNSYELSPYTFVRGGVQEPLDGAERFARL